MEFPFDPIVFKYEKDVTDDYETLYNSSFSSSLFPPGIFEYSPPSRPTSRSPSSRELRNEIGKITDLVDMNMRCWTKYSYQFYFHFLDEYRSNRLLTILLENNYYHTSLEPIIVCKQKIIENNTSQQFTSHPSDHQSQQSSFSPHFLSSPFDQSDSKNLQRSENRRISIKYSVYFCGIVRPLSSYYQLHACHSLPLSSSPREANVMNDLFHTQVTNIRSFITLLLSMTHELNELHSQGLCHSQLGMNSFLLYTPSTLDSTTRKEWGVQIMSHWLFLPSGPSDPSYTLHLPNSQAMLLSIQSDSYRLGRIFLEMTMTWMALRSTLLVSNSDDTSSKLSSTEYLNIFVECISSNHCSEEFELLLTQNLQDQPHATVILSEMIKLYNGLLHSDPWERYECFQVEVILTEIMKLF